ncbi:MAG: SGNH/GDSL hydrolase family protein [Nannocystis sp.]|nr:SGNH/GDSL hydrolase family protein [Nannocystis sp.]MBA3547875.1 SGNH/GDSL hydrolase family protein [Nannocystis sp.]
MRRTAAWLAPITLLAMAACTGPLDQTSDTEGGSSSSSSATTDEPTGSDPSAPGTDTGADTGMSTGSGSASATGTTGDPTTGALTSATSTSDATTGSSSGDDSSSGGDSTTGEPSSLDCLYEPFVNKGALMLDYQQFDPIVGSHCKGTNHQDIIDIERVVFLGDSVTVGTPPTQGKDFYRSELADVLVDRFGLTPPNALWKEVNPFDGVALTKDSGDFSSCAEWGARTDDFIASNNQILDCFPEDLRDKRTLVVITMGGNDLASVAKDGANGVPLDEVTADAEAFIGLMREAVHWFIDDPEKFPNGVFVVFSNVYEFTDGTGDLMSCPAAGLGGFDKPWADVEALKQLVLWIDEQFMEIAVDTQTDMIFMLENFCGHGFKAGDPASPCYRGPATKTFFDATCIHPTPAGHELITELFTAVIDE